MAQENVLKNSMYIEMTSLRQKAGVKDVSSSTIEEAHNIIKIIL